LPRTTRNQLNERGARGRTQQKCTSSTTNQKKVERRTFFATTIVPEAAAVGLRTIVPKSGSSSSCACANREQAGEQVCVGAHASRP
jgi:hypothetical protein